MAVHLCEALEDGGVVLLEQREPLDPARQAAASSTARRALPRFSDEAIEANRRIGDALRVIVERQGTTPAQLALSWVIRAGTTPIPGTTKPIRMQENAAAADVELTADDLARIDDASPHGAATGARNTEDGMARDRG